MVLAVIRAHKHTQLKLTVSYTQRRLHVFFFFLPFHPHLSRGETFWIQTEYFTDYWIISHAHLWGICIFSCSVASRVFLFYIWSSVSVWIWERGDVFARGIEKKRKISEKRKAEIKDWRGATPHIKNWAWKALPPLTPPPPPDHRPKGE